MSRLLALLAPYEGQLPQKVHTILTSFLESFEDVCIANGQDLDKVSHTMEQVLKASAEQMTKPYQFEPYHERIREPIDYYQMGIDFIQPLCDMAKSTLSGRSNLKAISEQLASGENVILFANHQIEADPQVISIMLHDSYPTLAEEMIFVAGERVLTDALAAPFSMGRNLLCIYSKKYIDTPPEDQHKKQLHNKRTMQLMGELLSKGGKCIYVAPSGGRDRLNKEGIVELAPFDPSSIEMFHLIARRSKTKTHFYPLSMATYSILPPPEAAHEGKSEKRITRGGSIHLHFGDAIDLDHLPGQSSLDKHSQRKLKSDYIFKEVNKAYKNFPIDY